MNPERYYNISATQLSIARHCGGIIINGAAYVYIADDDQLVRKDIFELDRKAQKKHQEQAEGKQKQEFMNF